MRSESPPPTVPRRIPVLSVFQRSTGPQLSLAMLTANARRYRDGALNVTFDIARQQTADGLIETLRANPGPTVLLLSDYLWTRSFNLSVALRARAVEPELLIIHGGPDIPANPGDLAELARAHPGAIDIAVNGEGEAVLVQILERISTSETWRDPATFHDVPGLLLVDAAGDVTVTAAPERIADLDALPSPYLSGEFDHLDVALWPNTTGFVETTRGCPYGCTFCDWGSATRSRIRSFAVDRVIDEVRWMAERGFAVIAICDANFGIMRRDVDIAEGIAQIRRDVGKPTVVALTPAKNPDRHLVAIFDAFFGADIFVSAAISLQTIDDMTLSAVGRRNISVEGYVGLAADLRRRGQALMGDLILGLPGQSLPSFLVDLQFMTDHEIAPRVWDARTLTNAPMNDAEYKRTHGIEVDDRGLVVSTATMSSLDRDSMKAIRDLHIVAERYGTLRHILRVLQWDHGIGAVRFLDRLRERLSDSPERFTNLAWVFGYFHEFGTVAVSWPEFYAEVRRFAAEEFGLTENDSGIDTAFRLQEFLMPAPGRTFPAEIKLEHDYVSYYESATDHLYTNGHAQPPDRPLTEYPPAAFHIEADPFNLCNTGASAQPYLDVIGFQDDFHLGDASTFELESALMRIAPVMRTVPDFDVDRVVAERISRIGADATPDVEAAGDAGEPVVLSRRRPRVARVDSPMPTTGSPYPWFGQQRARGEVLLQSDDVGHRPQFGVFSFAANADALQNDQLSSEAYVGGMGLQGRIGRTVIDLDGAEHRRRREMVRPLLSAEQVRNEHAAAIAGALDEVLSPLDARADADLVESVCRPLPLAILRRLLGLDEHTAAAVADVATRLNGGAGIWGDEQFDAAHQLFDVLRPVLRSRAGNDGTDVISVLARQVPDHLSERAVLTYLRVLVIAATDTVELSLGTTLAAVVANQEVLDAVRAGSLATEAVVDEAIRWECPALWVPRRAVADTEVAGVPIPAGADVLCHLGAANRDPRRWTDPDRFNPWRPRRSHLGFGTGPHTCMGSALGRATIGATVEACVQRFGGLRANADEPAAEVTGTALRGPRRLPVLLHGRV